jgi:hypothetical protein
VSARFAAAQTPALPPALLRFVFDALQVTFALCLTPVQIAKADVADDILQSLSKSGLTVVSGCALAIVFIAVCNSACERSDSPCLIAIYKFRSCLLANQNGQLGSHLAHQNAANHRHYNHHDAVPHFS